ncbi:MAG TPA: hypothetical protein VET23_15460, partial [Chitinophagaceae bacterium]|nr:hypothetical protein [Chitinophagaceae bacterium]
MMMEPYCEMKQRMNMEKNSTQHEKEILNENFFTRKSVIIDDNKSICESVTDKMNVPDSSFNIQHSSYPPTITTFFMKKFLCSTGIFAIAFVIANLFLVSNAVGQTVITSNTNWNAISPTPTSATTIEIRNNATLTVNVSNAVCASIQIGGNSGSGAGTLLFNSGSLVTVSGNVNLGSNVSSFRSGTITMTSGGTLTAQSLSLGTGGATETWTPGTGTVILTATNTLPSTIFTSFNNLTINGGTTTLGVNTSITGNLTVTSGTLNLSTFTANRSSAGGTL